jgi:hypothetical protein
LVRLSRRDVEAKGFEELAKAFFIKHGGNCRASIAGVQAVAPLMTAKSWGGMFHVERWN